MINLKFFERLQKFVKKRDKHGEKLSPEFVYFMSILIKEDIRCLDAMKFLFDYCCECAPADKKIDSVELIEKFNETRSYNKVAKEKGLSYNTVRNKIEAYIELVNYMKEIGLNKDFVDDVKFNFKYNYRVTVAEMLDFSESIPFDDEDEEYDID